MRPVSYAPPRAAESGISLIEVLLATGLLIASIAAVAHVFALASRANAEAQYTTYATVLAAQKMEELRAAPFPAGTVDAVDYADAFGTVLIGGGGSPQAMYERHWTIEPLPTALDTAAITVTVTRRGAPPAAGQVRLITLRARGRPGFEDVGETTHE